MQFSYFFMLVSNILIEIKISLIDEILDHFMRHPVCTVRALKAKARKVSILNPKLKHNVYSSCLRISYLTFWLCFTLHLREANTMLVAIQVFVFGQSGYLTDKLH
jgi:hypothetical protein